MRLKIKVLLLAVVPLLLSLAAIAVAVQVQQKDLAERERLQLRTAYMSTKEVELRHYVALALSTISPLYNSGRNDDEIKRLAMQQLAHLDYGADGYFFLYDMQGKSLMHPRQPELVGQNLIELRDAQGDPTIRMLLERARSGGGFVVYQWRKPSSQVVAPKLGYVTQMERWNWMVGTGLYLDDIDEAVQHLDAELAGYVRNTMLWIAGAGGLGVALIFACGLVLSVSEHRINDAKLTLLARKVVHSQEEERAHLSRELHDGTGQTLVAVKLQIESALEHVASTDAAVRVPLARSLDRLRDALHDVRGMSHRLRPVMLDTLGLPAALHALAEETCQTAGIGFTMDVEGELPLLSDELKTVLFRITQETLANIHKHAAAAHVSLLLEAVDGGLRLSIHDDGSGFDAQQVLAHPQRGIGLRNMRERAEAVGGRFSVRSQPGLTRITTELSARVLRRFNSGAPALDGARRT